MYLNVFQCVSPSSNIFECVKMQTYCWVVHLVGWRGTRVVELACWGAKSFLILIKFSFSFSPWFLFETNILDFLILSRAL